MSEAGTEAFIIFLSLGTDLSMNTQAQSGCFVSENIFDLAPNQLQSAVYDDLELFEDFFQGIMAPVFANDGSFECDLANFVKPSVRADVDQSTSQSSSGSSADGGFSRIGIFPPNSEPS